MVRADTAGHRRGSIWIEHQLVLQEIEQQASERHDEPSAFFEDGVQPGSGVVAVG
jgi:hypothetical protein